MSTVAPTRLNGDETDTLAAVVRGEPSRVGIWEAMRSHWRLSVFPVLILLPIAVALGVARSPHYTAEARLIVGRLDITNPGLSGYVTATQALADAYSRAVTAAEVTEPVARELHMSPQEVSSRLAGSPIQQSPVFRIIATGKTREQAIALANDASSSLITFVARLNRENPDGSRLLHQYQRATKAFDRANLYFTVAEKRFEHSHGKTGEAVLGAASAARASAQLQMTTLGALYQSSEAGQAISSLVGTLNAADTASSDRKSAIELLAVVAVLVGLAVGAALATASANRRGRGDGRLPA